MFVGIRPLPSCTSLPRTVGETNASGLIGFVSPARPRPEGRRDLEGAEEAAEDLVFVEGEEARLVRNAVVSGHNFSRVGKRGAADLGFCRVDGGVG